MKTILITGVAGFIGSHLAEKLLKEGHNVVGVDNFATGSEENVNRLKKIASECSGEFEFDDFNVEDEEIVEFLYSKYDGFDAVYHLACPASPKDFKEMGVDIMKTCALGTIHMLEFMRRQEKGTFLFTSTSEVYGDPLEHPQIEGYRGNVNTLGLRSCYDEGKRFSESYIVNFCGAEGIDFRIARVFNTYGPHMRKDDGRVMPNFIEQMNAGNSLTVYGDGSQTRSFCYVDDLVGGLVSLMRHDGFDNDPSNDVVERVFNIGNPHEVTILELAETLQKVAEKEVGVEMHELPQDDPKKRCPDISKAQKVFGFDPKTSLEEGLKKTLEAWD